MAAIADINEIDGLGGTLSPLIATTMITTGKLEWYYFYYIMIGIALTELCIAVTVFWKENGQKFRDDHPRTSGKEGGRTKEALSNRVVWICAVFLLVYVGIEVAIGGWVVSFMGTIRGSTPFAAGMAETGFWLGITLGRVMLGFVTGRIGEKLAILVSGVLVTDAQPLHTERLTTHRSTSPSPPPYTSSSTSFRTNTSPSSWSPSKASSSLPSFPPQS